MFLKIKKSILATAVILVSIGVIYTSCQQEEDIAPPTITLIGDNPMYMTLNADYIEPGFTVSDQEDGTISNDRVTVISNVDTINKMMYQPTFFGINLGIK